MNVEITSKKEAAEYMVGLLLAEYEKFEKFYEANGYSAEAVNQTVICKKVYNDSRNEIALRMVYNSVDTLKGMLCKAIKERNERLNAYEDELLCEGS